VPSRPVEHVSPQAASGIPSPAQRPFGADRKEGWPRSVAIITDGNGRWARLHGLATIAGHEAGTDTVKSTLRAAADFGVEQLTVYSFSTENWSRSDDEVSGLMALFERRITHEAQEMHAEGVRIRFIGRRMPPVPPSLVERIEWAERLTAENTRITLFIAFNYGGRAEIVDAARSFTGTTEAEFAAHLYAPDLRDPDLLIRTSGEQRVSNYLIWQTAYSELVFCDELWPDFTREVFAGCLDQFAERRRRFGGR
jgi:undecaprenyl diphosphate synthase